VPRLKPGPDGVSLLKQAAGVVKWARGGWIVGSVAPIWGLWGVCFEDPGLRPGLTEVAALRLEGATVATRRGFHVAFVVRGLKPTATGNRRDATADERCQLRGERGRRAESVAVGRAATTA